MLLKFARMTTLYFDQNVFGDILEPHRAKPENILPEDVVLLDQLVRDRIVEVPFSYMVLHESILASKHSDDLIQKVLSYSNIDKILKAANMLLEEDIEAYCRGENPPSYFVDGDHGKQALIDLQKGKWTPAELQNIRNHGIEQKDDFVNEISSGRKFAEAERGSPINRQALNKMSFSQFWESEVNASMESLLDKIRKTKGLSEDVATFVERQGIRELLKIRSVLASTGYIVSWFFHTLEQERKVKGPDAFDQLHAILASTADIFVTHDRTLAIILKRVPDLPYKVMTVREFCSSFVAEVA